MYPSDKYIHVQRNLAWDVACCGDAPSPLTEQMVSGVLFERIFSVLAGGNNNFSRI